MQMAFSPVAGVSPLKTGAFAQTGVQIPLPALCRNLAIGPASCGPLLTKKKRSRPNLNQFEPKQLLSDGVKSNIPDLNVVPCYELEEEENGEIVKAAKMHKEFKAQDAYELPKLFFELELEIFSRVSYVNYWKLYMLNKEYYQSLKRGDVFKLRRERKLVEPYVLMLSSGETCWTMFDKSFKNYRKLPMIPYNYFFKYEDKETISVGTHLIVIGKEEQQIVVWRYELQMNKWIKDSKMIIPRVMYGSASYGTIAFFAGGFKLCGKSDPEVTNIVEKYDADTKTWTIINRMHKRRKYSSGCFLHGRFYVIGGRDENNVYLTCGESYDEMTDSWNLIQDMLKDMMFMIPQSPPLIAVVNDNLYLLETWYNELWVYDIQANSWKKLGFVPARANISFGWGVAFKSIGDKLLLIGGSVSQPSKKTMSVYTCYPSPNVKEVIWEEITYDCGDDVHVNHYISNCCVMFV